MNEMKKTFISAVVVLLAVIGFVLVGRDAGP